MGKILGGINAPRAMVQLLLVAAIFGVIIGSMIPLLAANAATYKYANNISVAPNQEVSSGIYSTVSGGKVSTGLGIGTQTILTYYPAPGYSEVGRAIGYPPTITTLTHLSYNNARSKCFFSVGSITKGKATIECWIVT